MLTVVQYGVSYQFHTHGGAPSANPPSDVLIERRLYFESSRAALAFLRPFAANPFAVMGFRKVLDALGFHLHFGELRDEWMDRLATGLVTGRVTVIEIVSKDPATGSAEIQSARMPAPAPLPRRKPAEPPVEEIEAATFVDADEPAQVQTLVEAARSGTPFCEACARAAAAALHARQNNNAHAV